LKFCGLSFYDAINHTFATIASGGFSIKDQSIGYYHSISVELVISIFMILGTINFYTYIQAFRTRNISAILFDEEVKFYLIIILIAIFTSSCLLLKDHIYNTITSALRFSSFQVISTASTTGFSSTDYTNWPSSVLAILMILEFIGGTSGSTAGGLKQFRLLLIIKLVLKELYKLFHPNIVYKLNINSKIFDNEHILILFAFISAYTLTFLFVGLLLTFSGTDLVTAFSASIACISGSGPGLAKVGPAANFSFFHGWEKLLLSFEMILGRLELLTMLSIFLPGFWKE
jgi:trk system potassium uptake protein TrkH